MFQGSYALAPRSLNVTTHTNHTRLEKLVEELNPLSSCMSFKTGMVERCAPKRGLQIASTK